MAKQTIRRALELDLRIEQGSTFDLTLWWQVAGDPPTPLPEGGWDGWHAHSQGRPRQGDTTTAWWDVEEGSGIALVEEGDPIRRGIRIHLDDNQTLQVVKDGFWDLFVRQGEDPLSWYRFAFGKLLLDKRVTVNSE